MAKVYLSPEDSEYFMSRLRTPLPKPVQDVFARTAARRGEIGKHALSVLRQKGYEDVEVKGGAVYLGLPRGAAGVLAEPGACDRLDPETKAALQSALLSGMPVIYVAIPREKTLLEKGFK